jgi:hypothetical protein
MPNEPVKGINISPEFRRCFPATCEISRERSGNYEMHIYFDNSQQVGCWSIYADGTHEGEILCDDDAAVVRRWAAIETKIKKLTKAQRRAFELIAINLDHGTSLKIGTALQELGLIEAYEELKPSWPTPVTLTRYFVPLPVHQVWCYLAADEAVEEMVDV